MADASYLSGAYEANEIYTKLTVAFYMKATAPAVAERHAAEAHESGQVTINESIGRKSANLSFFSVTNATIPSVDNFPVRLHLRAEPVRRFHAARRRLQRRGFRASAVA